MKKIITFLLPLLIVFSLYLVVSEKDIHLMDFVSNLPNLHLKKFDLSDFREFKNNINIFDNLNFSWNKWSDVGKNVKLIGKVFVNLYNLIKSLFNLSFFFIKFIIDNVLIIIDYFRVVLQF